MLVFLQWVIAVVPYARVSTVGDSGHAVCSHSTVGDSSRAVCSHPLLRL